MDDTKTRILSATMKAVRQYGLEGARVQNISELAGVSPGAMYRYFKSKDELLDAAFFYVDRQVAVIFEQLRFDPQAMLADPLEAVRGLWQPYFRFWVAHPDETVFYHRFRDSASFPAFYQHQDCSYFRTFARMVKSFMKAFPSLRRINQDVLWLHVLTSTVMYAKYVVEGSLPDTQETEDTVFQFLALGLSGYLRPEEPRSGT